MFDLIKFVSTYNNNSKHNQFNKIFCFENYDYFDGKKKVSYLNKSITRRYNQNVCTNYAADRINTHLLY